MSDSAELGLVVLTCVPDTAGQAGPHPTGAGDEDNLLYMAAKSEAPNVVADATAGTHSAPAGVASTESTMVDLPLGLALKEVKGEGKRRMFVFEDPHCPYCKDLHTTLEQVDNVAVYVFLYPILTADSVVKARSIWCSPEPAAAWRAWMLDGKAPTAAGTCTSPIPKVLELARRLRVSGTPTIFFADGRRVTGAIPAEEIERYLTEAEKH